MTQEEQIEKYSEAHPTQCLHSVYQFVRRFGWSKQAEKVLYEKLHTPRQRQVMERRGTPHDEFDDGKGGTIASPVPDEPPKLGQVIGHCPKCGDLLYGAPFPGCETELTGRYYLKECGRCPYYSEIFYKAQKYTEIEGGD